MTILLFSTGEALDRREMSYRRKLFSSLAPALHATIGRVSATPGGSIKVCLPRPCILNIRPLDPHTSDWDHVHVALQVLGSHNTTSTDTTAARKMVENLGLSLNSKLEQDRSLVRLEAPTVAIDADALDWHANLVVNVSLPGLFDVNVKTHSGAVNIVGTIEGDVKIHCNDAAVNIEKLKSMNVDIDSAAGGVSAGVLQGSIAIRAGTGNISIGKMQGPRVSLETTSGGVQARAMYTDYAVIRTDEGSVHIEGAQGSTTITTRKGNVDVAGVQGKLTVESDSGNVNAQLSRPEDISIRSSKGNVSVGIPEQIEATVALQGKKGIAVDQRIKLQESANHIDTHFISGLYTPSPTHGEPLSDSIWGDSDTAQPPNIEARAPSGEIRLCLEKWGSRFTTKLGQG